LKKKFNKRAPKWAEKLKAFERPDPIKEKPKPDIKKPA